MKKKKPVIVLCGQRHLWEELLDVLKQNIEADYLQLAECVTGFTRLVDLLPDCIIIPYAGEEEIAAFLRQKNRSRVKAVPLVVLLPQQEPGSAAALLDLGIDEVLTPPWTGNPLVLARIRALLRIRAQYNELERTNYDNIRLYKLTRKMHATLDIEELIRMVTEETREILDVDQVNLLLLEQDPGAKNRLYVNSSNFLKKRTVENILKEFRNWIRNLKFNKEVSRNVILKYIPRIGPGRETETDELLNVVFTNYLKTKDEFVGIMNFLDRDKKELTQGEMAITSALSQHLAFSIKNILLFEALNFLARKDELTQLFNRRYFNERFTDEFLRNKRYGSFFSCIMCDLDHFKSINDTYGHQQGDIVLRSFGDIIRESIRRIDIAARFGGEEFIMLLPETTAEDALQVAERIRTTLMKKEFPFGREVTASFGIICTRDSRIETRQEMIRLADVALYNAKHFGRNRTVIYNDTLPEVSPDAPDAEPDR